MVEEFSKFGPIDSYLEICVHYHTEMNSTKIMVMPKSYFTKGGGEYYNTWEEVPDNIKILNKSNIIQHSQFNWLCCIIHVTSILIDV